MKIEKRIFLFLIGLALVISGIVYTTTKNAYDNPAVTPDPAASSTVNDQTEGSDVQSDTVDKGAEGP